MRALPLIAAVLALALLAACDQRVVMDKSWTSQNYRTTDLETYGAGRDFHTVVIGDPFGQGQAAFTQAVTRELSRQSGALRVNLTDRPDASASDFYRIVLAFNPATSLSRERLCRNQASVSGGPPQKDIELAGAFCGSNKAVTYLQARFKGPATSVRDPEFREFLRAYMQSLFPRNASKQAGL